MRPLTLGLTAVLIEVVTAGLGQQSIQNRPSPPATPPARITVAPVQPDRVIKFNPAQTDVRRLNGSWCLLAGDVLLKDFGPHESDARTARGLIHSLNLNEMAVIGRGQPAFEFFLVNGQPPQGSLRGTQLVRFNPDRLDVQLSLQGWQLQENEKPLSRFSMDEDQARRALAVIRHYRFNEVGYLGGATHFMAIWVRSPGSRSSGGRPGAGPMNPQPAGVVVSTNRPLTEREGKAPSGPRPKGNKARKPHASSSVDDPQNRTPFDHRQARLFKMGSDWKLMVGSYPLKEFGSREREAREALRVIQHYRFTEQYEFGRGEDRFEYYLANGQSPQGRMAGQDAVPLQPDSLAIREIDGVCWITHAEGRLFRFANSEDAKQALQVIRAHRFDHVCTIGRPKPVMTYFIRTR